MRELANVTCFLFLNLNSSFTLEVWLFFEFSVTKVSWNSVVWALPYRTPADGRKKYPRQYNGTFASCMAEEQGDLQVFLHGWRTRRLTGFLAILLLSLTHYGYSYDWWSVWTEVFNALQSLLDINSSVHASLHPSLPPTLPPSPTPAKDKKHTKKKENTRETSCG